MKQRLTILLCIILLCFSACSLDSTPVQQTTPVDTAASSLPQAAPQTRIQAESSDAMGIKITIGAHSFQASLFDNTATRAFFQLLPLEVPMQALNGNEFYHYLTQKLPTNAETPGNINAGDLMLYGSDCLVLFYKNAPTPYSYTPLGKLHNPKELAKALATEDSAVVLFEQLVA